MIRYPAISIATKLAWPVGIRALSLRLIWLVRGALTQVALISVGAGVGVSSLTFGRVWSHDVPANYFPEFAGGVIYLSDVLLATGFVFWIVARLSYRRAGVDLGPPYVWIPLAALTILSWASVIWALESSVAVWSAAHRTLLLAVYVMIVNEFGRFHRIAAMTLIGFAVAHALVALGQVYQQSALGLGIVGELRPGAFGYELIGANRGYGLGFNPNPVGALIAIGALISYGLLIIRHNGRVAAGVLVATLVVTLIGIGATGSRSAMIGVVIGAGAVTALGLRSADIRLARIKPYAVHTTLLIIAVGGAFIILASGHGQIQVLGLNRFTPDRVAAGLAVRYEDLSLSYPIIRSASGIGVGSGNYPLALKEEIAPDIESPKLTPVHNVPLLTLAELGVIGLAAWVALASAPVIWFMAIQLKGRKPHWRSYLWFSPLAAVFIESLFDFTPWATQDGRVIFVALVALWAGSIRAHGRGKGITPAVRAELGDGPDNSRWGGAV